jgi:hypothetical protein
MHGTDKIQEISRMNKLIQNVVSTSTVSLGVCKSSLKGFG